MNWRQLVAMPCLSDVMIYPIDLEVKGNWQTANNELSVNLNLFLDLIQQTHILYRRNIWGLYIRNFSTPMLKDLSYHNSPVVLVLTEAQLFLRFRVVTIKFPHYRLHRGDKYFQYEVHILCNFCDFCNDHQSYSDHMMNYFTHYKYQISH